MIVLYIQGFLLIVPVEINLKKSLLNFQLTADPDKTFFFLKQLLGSFNEVIIVISSYVYFFKSKT